MFPTTNRAFKMLQAWIKYPRRQAVLTHKIVERLRNSLELQVVLQSAVDEVASILELDCCSFLWYFPQTQRVRVVCERTYEPDKKLSQLGYHPLENFGATAKAIAAGKLIVNSAAVKSKSALIRQITQQFPWIGQAVAQSVKRKDDPEQHLSHSLRANHKIFGYDASLLIPVTNQDGSIGFLACFSEHPRTWSRADIKFLESIANPLEVAIRQAQLYKQTQQQAIRERLVNQITTQTRQSFDPETILTEAIAQLLEALQADRCLVHLVDDLDNQDIVESQSEKVISFAGVDSAIAIGSSEASQRKQLYEVCRPPFAPSFDKFEPYGPVTRWVIQHRELVMIPDVTQDERIGKANTEYQKAQIQSSLVVPVQANGTLHALLYLNQCSYIRYWSKNDQKLAQAVADQLAISLQQAYLYARTQQQAVYSAQQAQKMSEMLEELRFTQAQLIQSEKMSSLGRMVAGVAHEINNSINFIYGNIPYVENYVSDLIRLVQAYQAHCPQAETPVQTLAEEIDLHFLLRDLPKILKSMESGAERIHEIVQLLQKFSGNNLAPLKIIDLNASLENTLLILHNQLTGTITVERHYDDTLPPVECYPTPINQTFLSLLSNAIEALNRSCKSDKRITLCTKWIPSRELQAEDRVQIIVRDNGLGIKPEIQPRIFEPFFTTKDIGQGRGLGLTVSYQTIVSQHNGQLEVKSQLGQGAEFILEIPIRHSKPLRADSSLYTSITPSSQTKSLISNPKSVAAATNSGC